MGVFVAMAFVVAVAVGSAVALFQFLSNYQPGRGRLRRDLRKLKAQLAPYVTELVPLKGQELDLLSQHQVSRRIRKRMGLRGTGVFTTIYHEPVIAYAFRKYLGPAGTTLVYARTADHEFVFQRRRNETKIFIDGQPVGVLRPGRKLYSPDKRRLLAAVRADAPGEFLPVVVKDREIGSLVKPVERPKINHRALQFVQAEKEEEKALLLSFALLELVGRELEQA